MRTRGIRWSWLVLGASLAACSGSTGPGYLVIEVTADNTVNAALVTRIHLSTTIAGMTRDLDLERGGQAIPLPTTTAYELSTVSGTVMVNAAAFGAAGQLGQGIGAGAVGAGDIGKVTVVLSQVVTGDGGPPDARPSTDGSPGVPDGGTTADGPASKGPVLVLDPPSIAFGNVVVGNPSRSDVSVRNDGDAVSGVPSIMPGAGVVDFTIEGSTCQAVIQPGASCGFTVVFRPQTAGRKDAEILVAADPPKVTLRLPVSGTGLTPGALQIAPTEFDFGTAAPGMTSAPTTFTVTNTGGQTTGPVMVVVKGAMQQFKTTADTCSGTRLDAGKTCTLGVTFAPDARMQFLGSVEVSGTPGGVTVASLRGTGALAAALSLGPATGSATDFSGVILGSSKTYTYVVRNVGDGNTGPLSITLTGPNAGGDLVLLPPAGGDCVSGTRVLAGGDSCTIRVTFTPSGVGGRSAKLGVTANPGGAPTLDLVGTGVTDAALGGIPGSYDAGGVEIGRTGTPLTWHVRNNGDVPTGSLNFSNSNPTDFTIVANTCNGVLNPGTECTVTVAFRPNGGGVRSGVLTVSASPGGVVQLQMSGVGQYRLTVMNQGGGIGLVTSDVGGIVCGAACSILVDGGTLITLLAETKNGNDSYFAGWSGGGCAGLRRSCVISVNATTTVTANFLPMKYNLIFATSQTYRTDLGDYRPYDAACNQAATNAGVNTVSNDGYIAFLSDNNAKATARLANGVRGWVRLDGRPFADSQTALFTSNQVFNAVRFNDRGEDVWSDYVMTGTYYDGSVGENCKGFTTADPSVGVVGGSLSFGPFGWTGGAGFACNATLSLLCVGNTKAVSVVPTVAPGKLIWLSSRALRIGAETPDSLCMAERPVSVTGAKAFIAYDGKPASAVLDMSATYVRPDGQVVGIGADIAAVTGGILQSGIWQFSNGTYGAAPTMRVWGGALAPNAPGTLMSTCANWTGGPVGMFGWQGFHVSSNSQFFYFVQSQPCVPVPNGNVYCVQTAP